jgi:hypothetical protein
MVESTGFLAVLAVVVLVRPRRDLAGLERA